MVTEMVAKAGPDLSSKERRCNDAKIIIFRHPGAVL
jgi:hypothetical protein